MNYEAIILDPIRGHFRRGVGPSPLVATLNAFRKILAFEVPENQQDQIIAKVDQAVTANTFLTVAMEDQDFEDPKNMREEVHDRRILVRVDKTKENMYTPCGWVGPIL